MKIGVDLDGTIKLWRWERKRFWKNLPFFLQQVMIFLLGKVSKTMKGRLVKIKKKGCVIIIVTSRPKLGIVMKKTKDWLEENEVPFDEIVFVGPIYRKRNKLRVLLEKGVECFIEDEKGIRERARRLQGVSSISPTQFAQREAVL